MMHVIARRLAGQEGAAMIIAVTLSAVIATLAALMLTVGTHTDHAAARGRHWIQALHVAESGMDHAIARIEEAQGSIGSPSTTFTGTTEEGEYEVTIVKGERNTFTIEATGGVRTGAMLGVQRKIRASLAPPETFDSALFSYTTVETKNNDIIQGDIWANHNVLLANDTNVTGSVTAATGYIRLSQRAVINGDAWSGGFDPASGDTTEKYAIYVGGNGRIDGHAKASVVTVGCAGVDNSRYKVRLQSGAIIGGGVTTYGSITGEGTAYPPITTSSCTPAAPTKSLPTFTWSPANYDPATLYQFGTPDLASATAIQDFQAHLSAQGNRLNGTYYVNQADPVNQAKRVDLTNSVIAGDVTIVTNTPIYTNGLTDEGTSDKIFVLISTYKPPAGSLCDVNDDLSDCSAHIKNNLSVSGSTAALVFTPYGPTAIKNSAESFGAVYADSIQVKNNQTLTYDSRIARIAGFGQTTLEIVKWEEINAA